MHSQLNTDAATAAMWLCLAAVAYAYLLYPPLVWLCSRCFGRVPRPVEPAHRPTVSLLVVAHNEEGEIGRRIENALACDYPADRLEVVVASDGSADNTAEVVRGFADRGVRLVEFSRRRGKASVLNDVIPTLAGEIVVLSDANTTFDRDAVRLLAAWFADPATGVVCGRLVLTDPATGRNADGLYWRYETFLKECESRLGALLGSNGGIYAIRRDLFVGIPADTLVDDFVLPLSLRERSGCRLVYDRDAVAVEETPASIDSEFERRARIGAGGFQSIGLLWSLLSPRHGWVSFTFLSHKVLRWLCPFFLLAAFAINLCLLPDPGYATLLALQAGFYAASLAAGWLPARPRALRVLRLGTMFTKMNAALFVGFCRWALGRQGGAWKRTPRAPAGVSA